MNFYLFSWVTQHHEDDQIDKSIKIGMYYGAPSPSSPTCGCIIPLYAAYSL